MIIFHKIERIFADKDLQVKRMLVGHNLIRLYFIQFVHLIVLVIYKYSNYALIKMFQNLSNLLKERLP